MSNGIRKDGCAMIFFRASIASGWRRSTLMMFFFFIVFFPMAAFRAK